MNLNQSNNNTKKQNDFASFNIIYFPKNYAYKIKMVDASDPNIKDLLINKFTIDKIFLDLDGDTKNNSFQIKEKIKCEIIRSNNGSVILKNQNDYVKIVGPNNKKYYLKFSIDVRYSNEFISIAFIVYEEYNRYLYKFFRAAKTIPGTQLNSLNFEYNENKKNINLNNNNQFKSFQESNKSNQRSKSLNNNNSFQFNKKAIELLEQERKYLYSEIKNIPYLTKLISTKIFGLKNLGNTCFLNSSLQIIIHSPIFIEKFLEDISKIKPNDNSMAYEFFNFIMNIAYKDQKSFSPHKFISRFTKKSDMFSLGQQSDSQRFYRNFLTILENELGSDNTCIKNTFLGSINFTMENRCSNPICQIGKTFINTSQQPFYDIFLAIPENESTVDELISLTYNPQIIKLKKKCDCRAFLNVIRSTAIKPNIYFNMNIQRAKIETRNLKNTKLIIDNLYGAANYFYEPYAINFHVGSGMDFGHYYR